MGNKASRKSEHHLEILSPHTSADPEENKYPEDNERRFPMQELFDPFPPQKQQKVQQLFDSKIQPLISKHHCKLTSTQLIKWISNYLKEENYESDAVISQDLNDTAYSHLKVSMGTDLCEYANPLILSAIYIMLKDEVFSIDFHQQQTHSINNSLSSFISVNTEHKELDDLVMFDAEINLRQKTVRKDEVQMFEDEYTANKESFPEFINIALFGRSDDEYLEMLIDKALQKVCYSAKFEKLWNDPKFVKSIYNDDEFPDAVQNVYESINHDDDKDDLEFIGDFVSNEFKRQINENKRRIEKEARDNEVQHDSSRDLDSNHQNVYDVLLHNDGNTIEYVIRQKHAISPKDIHRNLIKLKDEDPLFQIEVQEMDHDKYCWAVWKRQKFPNTYGIRTKGKWEIITKEADNERQKEEEESATLKQKDLLTLHKVLQKTKTKMKLFAGSANLSGRVPGLEEMKEETSLEPDHDYGAGDTIKSPKKKKKKSTFQYISLRHLNVIFELMQYHYLHSIQEAKQKIIIAKKEPKLVASPLYNSYCTVHNFNERDLREKQDSGYNIRINDKLYHLQWWNAKGRSDCNAFTIKIGQREYYYMRFKHNYQELQNNKTIKHRMLWDWYNNDTAKYCPYHPGINNEVYQELEASFQSNIESNFPRPRFDAKSEKENEPKFNICILPQLKKFLKDVKKKNIECMVLRFTFTEKSNRILNIEQVSLRSRGSAFPRNVRRLLDSKNSLDSYWQNTNKFIEEWKNRYLLSTRQQQLYFWSYILCIAATMKYIEIEFDHQMISIPFEKSTKKQDAEYTGLDDSDLQRHKIDCQLWNGFFMPPMNQLQTAQISKNLNVSDNFEDWYESLSRVEPLSKFKNVQKDGPELLHKRIACNHQFKNDDILWYSKSAYEVFCNRCATLLRFSECIRKFVLETDSNEVVDFMWPWYRNYFHRKDRKKYLKYIAKYNLSHLFMIRDVLHDPYNRHSEERNNKTDEDNRSVICCKSSGDKKEMDTASKKQIRHLRKFAASVLLGPFDILRNINVIKSQLNLYFLFNSKKFINDDEKSEEKAETEEENNQSGKPRVKEEKSWKQWQKELNAANEKAQQQINGSDRKTILELRHAEIELSDEHRNISHSLIKSVLEEHAQRRPYGDVQCDDKRRYYAALRDTFHRTPKWWTVEHDILLIELSLKFNWNKEEINKELTDESKKYYYQELLKTVVDRSSKLRLDDEFQDVDHISSHSDEDNADDENDEEEEFMANYVNDDFEYRGYQEFQVWCTDWRNIQHRLRYLSFIVCKYLNDECSPSIIEIRIPNPKDRVEQYASNSFIFLNGYVEKVHVQNCNIDKKYLKNIISKNKRIRSFGKIVSPKTLRKAKYSKIGELPSNTARMRDPFMTRNLEFELEQICQSFDLLECGVDIALFLIKLLARKQSESLWQSLGIVLEYMPYEGARFVLNEKREDLRHGEPEHLKKVCDRIRRGSHFSVHICLFLAEYMESNANQDLARHDKWMEFSKHYEDEAGAMINDIESDHLLSVLIDIPLEDSGKQKVPLLQVALEQNRAQFLNNERINAVLKHVWQTPSGLDPSVEILRKSRTSRELCGLLLDQPFHFYLTPMGFNIIIKALYLIYLMLIFVFISQRIYLDDALSVAECGLWTLNIGYFAYECIEAYDKGLRDYFTLAGWVNYWDLQISATWLILFAIRMVSVYYDYNDFDEDNDDNRWNIAQTYFSLWAAQCASMSGRALVLFQTSEYFGVLLRMMKSLIAAMCRFMFVLALILVGFVFGLYYIQGGYLDNSPEIGDWYDGFRFLFQLTVGAGDFNEIEDIVENQITAQIYSLTYVILAAILMMNLLIALMTTTFESVYKQARTESSFAIAETTFDLSHRSRFMPAPICIYIFGIAVLVHILNFPFAMIWPKRLNVYAYINHHRYESLVKFSFSEVTEQICAYLSFCRKRNDEDDDKMDDQVEELKVDENATYELITRGRVWKYYASTLFMHFCCEKKLNSQRFKIHHTGCFCCIPTKIGAKVAWSEKDRSTCNGITLNEYAEAYEDHHRFALDPQDTVLLKHLTVNTLFCKFCYKPFDPQRDLDDVLFTPFWALSELISIYLFPFTVWPLLVVFYALLSFFEKIGSLFDEKDSDAPNVLDHDRQYFQKETLNLSSDL